MKIVDDDILEMIVNYGSIVCRGYATESYALVCTSVESVEQLNHDYDNKSMYYSSVVER